jgi:hypothetical protein
MTKRLNPTATTFSLVRVFRHSDKTTPVLTNIDKSTYKGVLLSEKPDKTIRGLFRG